MLETQHSTWASHAVSTRWVCVVTVQWYAKQCARHLAGNTSKHVHVIASALETTRTHTRRPDAEEHVKCFGTDRQTSDPGDSLLA